MFLSWALEEGVAIIYYWVTLLSIQLNINKGFNLSLPVCVYVVAMKSLYGDGHESISINMLMGN